jgi:hypothetical protein
MLFGITWTEFWIGFWLSMVVLGWLMMKVATSSVGKFAGKSLLHHFFSGK